MTRDSSSELGQIQPQGQTQPEGNAQRQGGAQPQSSPQKPALPVESAQPLLHTPIPSRGRRGNTPVDVTWREGTARLMNLVIALARSNTPRSFEWIRTNVDGYSTTADPASVKRQFDRDRATLADVAGIRLVESTVDSEFGTAKDMAKGWTLEAAATFMPRVEFSAQEKEILATAAQWAHGHEQQAVARIAFRKLASAGVAALDSQAVVTNVPDHIDLDQASLQALFRALDRGLRIEFDYYPAPLVEPMRRQLDPWAFATIGGRTYVTGFDPDKQGQRTFRLARLGGVEALPQFVEHQAPGGVGNHALVRRGLSRAGELIDAKLEFRGPGAWELRDRCDATEGTAPNASTVSMIRGVQRQWLVRTAAAYATDAVIIEPSDVAAEVHNIVALASCDEEHTGRTAVADSATPNATPNAAPNATDPAPAADDDLAVPDATPSEPSHALEPHTYGEQFVRCVDLLAWFANHPGGSFMAAARDLGTSVPQIKHELTQLEFCGLPGYLPGSLIEIEFHKTGATIQFSAGIDSPIRLTAAEAATIRVSLDAIRDVIDPTDADVVDGLIATIAGLAAGTSIHSDAPTHPPHTADEQDPKVSEFGKQQGVDQEKVKDQPHIHLRLTEAIRHRCTVTVEYTSLSSDSRTTRTLLPDHLGVVDGETYLWARETDEAKPGQRRYALSRMNVREVGEEGSAGKRVQPRIDSANPFGWSESTPWARVAIDESARWMLEYQQMWVIDDDVEANGGEILVMMPDTGAWIERFLIAYTPSVRCMQPLELVARVRSRARRGLANYTD